MINHIKYHIFLAGYDRNVWELVHGTLEKNGFRISDFTSATECLEQLVQQKCNLLIINENMLNMDGIDILASVKHNCPWLSVIIIVERPISAKHHFPRADGC